MGGPFWCWRFCLFQGFKKKRNRRRLESRTFMRWRSSASRDYDISQASHGSQTGPGESHGAVLLMALYQLLLKKKFRGFPAMFINFHMYSMNSWTLMNHAANIKQLYDIQYIYMIIYGRQIVFRLGWSTHPGFSCAGCIRRLKSFSHWRWVSEGHGRLEKFEYS